MTREDWVLMHRVAAGDENAVAELYDRFAPLVYKVARQLMPTQADADDAVQEVFVRLWRTADRYDPHRAKLVTWVMLIARRHLIDRIRRAASRPKATGIDADHVNVGEIETADLPGEQQERNHRLLERLNQLSDLQRTVIERTYLQGYTLREVSEQLDAPLGTVKSALSRGLQRLRDQTGLDRVVQ